MFRSKLNDIHSSSILKLSTHEESIIQLLLSGFTNRKIASMMNTSRYTLDSYLENIFKKFGVTNRYDFVERFNCGLRPFDKSDI